MSESQGMERMFRVATAPTDLAREGATTERCRTHSGIHVKFDNGWVVSIQWGPGTYSDNHNSFDVDAWDKPAPDSTSAEVAVWNADERADNGPMRKWADGDSVQGWQSWEQVQALLDLAAADAIPDPIAVPSSTATNETEVSDGS